MTDSAAVAVSSSDAVETIFSDEKLQKSMMGNELVEGLFYYVGMEQNQTREALRKSMECSSSLMDGLIAMQKSMTAQVSALNDQITGLQETIAGFAKQPAAGFKSAAPGATAQVLEKSMTKTELEVDPPKYPKLEKMTKSMVSSKLSQLFEAEKIPVGLLSKFDVQGVKILPDSVKEMIENS